MAHVYRVGISDHSRLSEDERVQFDMLMVTYFRNMQNLFHQHRRRLLEREVWEGSMRNMLWYIRQPGVRAWWETRRRQFSGEFCEFLEVGAWGEDGRGESSAERNSTADPAAARSSPSPSSAAGR